MHVGGLYVVYLQGGSFVTKSNIVVCDGDREYVEAFTTYLMEHIPNISIYSFTSEEAFLRCEEEFAVGILSKDFLSVLEFSGKETVEEKLYLCDENIAPEFEHLPMVYKYQSMEIVEEMLGRMLQKDMRDWWGKQRDNKTRVIGIYSPIFHELSMPFGLSLCQVLRESGRVLFLDIEENSIMGAMTGQANEKSLMDLLYFVVQQDNFSLGEFIHTFMGVDYISPFANPEEVNDISREAWEALMQYLLRAGYDTVVILFGRTVQGFHSMVSMCQELVVLGKPGDYYQRSQESFLKYAGRAYENVPIKCVSLPMSAGNLVDGTYAMEELIQGNLGVFVRKLLKDGMISRGSAYGSS